MLWAENLEEVDREIARLATLCQVGSSSPTVMRRVLQKDDSVCGTQNPVAFAKLHDLLMLHLAIRQKSVDSFGAGADRGDRGLHHRAAAKSFPDGTGKLAARVATEPGRAALP